MGIAVKVSKTKAGIEMETPYNAAFVLGVKKISGKYNQDTKVWTVPSSLEGAARALLVETFGTDGSAPVEMVDLAVEVINGPWYADCSPIYLGPIEVARAWGRDSGAKLADGVALLAGTSAPFWAKRVVFPRDTEFSTKM